MMRYLLVSLGGGLLFAFLDGLINANPLAVRLYAVYKPIARTSLNPLAGIAVDLVYGFVVAGVFLLLYRCLPGGSGLAKGVSLALLVWFFRVVMQAASQWVMFSVPPETLLYSMVAGLGEMLILGLFWGLTLKPTG